MGQEKNRPRFAVLLAAYNGMNYIEQQINSILNQKNVDLQIFISIDKSKDGTENFLVDWAKSESRLKLLALGEQFGGAGPNFYRLLREVDFKGFNYIAFSDQDDIWHPEKLNRAYHVILANAADGYSSNFTAFWSNGKEKYVNKASRQRSSDFFFESGGPGCTYVLNSILAESLKDTIKNQFNKLKYIEYHDWLFYAYARAYKYKWIIDNWSSIKYRQHQNNQIGVNSGFSSILYRSKKVLSGHAFRQSILISEICQSSKSSMLQLGLHRGRWGYFWLAFHARECRRRPIEQIWFFISCIILCFLNPKVL